VGVVLGKGNIEICRIPFNIYATAEVSDSMRDLMLGFGKPQLHAEFEITDSIYYGNIRESVFKRQICFLSYPLGY